MNEVLVSRREEHADSYVADELRAKGGKKGLWKFTFNLPEAHRMAQRFATDEAQQPRTAPRSRQPDKEATVGCAIKSNRNRRGQWIYHLPGVPYYDVTRPEELFCSEARAQVTGYRKAIVR